ncbi:MAG: hypothetical protein OEL81_08375 [Nitrosopumilus sp.]|nr:hypothetical protein [Nitrosopumilus sp.]
MSKPRFFGISFVLAFLIFGAIDNNLMAFGETLDPYQNDSIELEGNFNILEISYADGTYDMKYYLFVDSPLANNPIPYQLEFTNPTDSLMDLLSENVIVRGHIPNTTVAQFSNSFSDVNVIVDSIEKITPDQDAQGYPAVAQTNTGGTAVPSELQTHVVLSKFSDNAFEPHNSTYFNNLFFNSTAGAYSLTNYFNSASYGALNITSSGIHDWSTLGNTTSFYGDLNTNTILNFTYEAIKTAELAHGIIDFNGTDNTPQNTNQLNLLSAGPNGDDIDHLIFIFNGNSFNAPDGCSCAFAFLGPVGLQTHAHNATMFFLLSYLPDLTPNLNGFAVDTGYRGGFGVLAHEYGHSLGWDHTPTPPPILNGPYDDPWSLMSKISDSVAENGAGPIAYDRSHAGWIPPADIITISNNQTMMFTLDKLSDPSPGPGFLLANITFGGGVPSDYYTLEARINDTFDHTPENKTGLLMYHVSQTGHPGTAESTAEASIVDVNGAATAADWKDANLTFGQNFTVNNVKVAYLSHNATSITVEVANNVSIPSSCTPPGVGNWVITSSCTMTASASAAGNVIVQNGVVLTIPSGVTLTVPSSFSATVLSGGGISIPSGGTLIIIS